LWVLTNNTSVANAPTIPDEELLIVQGNSLLAISNPRICDKNAPLTGVCSKDDMIDLVRKKYPEMADLLICVLKKESSFCQHLRGDKGLAWGCWQIHLDKHDITKECAMNFECSLDWTAQKIKEGRGYLWSAYKECLNP
jgi:hypothetical protein